MEQVFSTLNRAVNSNAVINTLLLGVFGVLAARSGLQERTIEALQEEKDSLLKSNKAIKSTIWEWKQKLYAEAEANPHKPLVPLSTLKSIYGEVVAPASPIPSGNPIISPCFFVYGCVLIELHCFVVSCALRVIPCATFSVSILGWNISIWIAYGGCLCFSLDFRTMKCRFIWEYFKLD